MLRIGLVGCGTIGLQLARVIEREYQQSAKLVALHDKDRAKALNVQRNLSDPPRVYSLPALIQKSQLIIEAASIEAALFLVPAALRKGRSVFVMSVGALIIDKSWRKRALQSGGRVYVPSGALAGLDGIKAMAVGKIRHVSLTTRKPPRALSGTTYLQKKGIRLEGRKQAVVVFEGRAGSVVKAFPQNTNVAAALSLAARSLKSGARIRVVADPSIKCNTHELEVVGDCGSISCRIESSPSRQNPKTSEIAVRSAIATLERILSPIQIGT